MKRVDEIWWCGTDPSGVTLWPYLDLRKKNVKELLKENVGAAWESKGWRIAKLLRVVEVAS